MTSQVFHQSFNDAIHKILNNTSWSKDSTRKLGDFVMTADKEEDGRTLVYAITDNSDKKNVVRVSHRVKSPDYRGEFAIAVNGQTTSAEEKGIELFKRILSAPTAPAFARSA